MSDEDDKIARPSFGDPKVTIDRSASSCSPEFVLLRKRSHTVVCRVCRELVDPWDILERLARKWENCTWEQQKLQELSDSIESLKREEANVKARVRKGHAGAAPDPKVKVYFEELMRRVGEIQTNNDEYDLRHWMMTFDWLDQHGLLPEHCERPLELLGGAFK